MIFSKLLVNVKNPDSELNTNHQTGKSLWFRQEISKNPMNTIISKNNSLNRQHEPILYSY